MRKRVSSSLAPSTSAAAVANQPWFDLETIAEVEVTSEEQGFPIEAALLPEKPERDDTGWRAAVAGPQTIRLHFDEPQRLQRIQLSFEEREAARTQEFVLRSSSNAGQSFRDIVRQQWNFSPPDGTREVEDYRVELSGVTSLELTIVPDISHRPAIASLLSLRVG